MWPLLSVLIAGTLDHVAFFSSDYLSNLLVHFHRACPENVGNFFHLTHTHNASAFFYVFLMHFSARNDLYSSFNLEKSSPFILKTAQMSFPLQRFSNFLRMLSYSLFLPLEHFLDVIVVNCQSSCWGIIMTLRTMTKTEDFRILYFNTILPSQQMIQKILKISSERKSKHFHALLDITYGWLLNDESFFLWNVFYSNIYVLNKMLAGYNEQAQTLTLLALMIEHYFASGTK